MSDLSVQINHLNIGSSSLDVQKFFPFHKGRAEKEISNLLLNQKISTEKQAVPFRLWVKKGGPILDIAGQRIISPKLKEVDRLIRYGQHIGYIPRALPKEALQTKALSEDIVRAMNAASIPGNNERILAGMRITEDTLSLTRNILFAIPSIGADDPIVNHLGYYAALFWTFFSLQELSGAKIEHQRSKLIQDKEGMRRSAANMASGAIVTTASLSYLAGKFLETLGAVATSGIVMRTADALFGVGSLLSMGISGLGAYRCYRFNEKLNEYLFNPSISEKERLTGVLHFLRDSITVTPEEKEEFIDEIEKAHPDLSQEKKKELLEKKLADLSEVKVKYLKRRTSNRSLYLIITQVDALLAKLSDPKTLLEGIKETTLLLHEIQKENRAKMALHIIGFIAALIGSIAMISATILTMGTLPFVLYGIAGTIYLAMSLYNIAIMANKGVREQVIPNSTQKLAAKQLSIPSNGSLLSRIGYLL